MTTGTGGPMLCPPWNSIESPDYFNACGNLNTGVPFNILGFQPALSGEAYAGVFCRFNVANSNLREYMQVQLDQPLEAGTCYRAGCYINLGDGECGIDRFGIMLSTDPILNPLGEIPQINPMGTFFIDQDNWMLITGEFIAEGGEQYLTLGNFAIDANTQFYPPCDIPGALAYYYVEDVFVEETTTMPLDLDLNGPFEGCESVTIDAGIPEYTYQWSNGGQGQSITVTESGVYSVTATFGCATVEDEVEVIVVSSPQVELGPDVDLCPGETVSFELDPDQGVYTWQDGSSSPSYTVSTPGLYQVTVENECGTAIDDILIQAIPELPSDPLGSDQILCDGELVTFDFDPTLGDFLWQDNSTSSSYLITTSGLYSVTISNACGIAEDEIEVTFVEPPSLFLEDTVQLCDGEFYLIELDPEIATYVWDDGSTDPEYTISESGVYTVTATNGCGQDEGTIVAILSEIPDIDLGPDLVLCEGDSVILGEPVYEGNPQWQDGSTTPQINVNMSGTYTLTLSNVCGSAIDSVTVSVTDTVIFAGLGPDFSLCPGASQVLYANIPIGNISWSDGSMADSLLITQAGLYSITITTSCQTISDTVAVTIDAAPPAFTFPDTILFCAGDTVRLDPQLTGVSFNWSTGATSSFIDITSTGTYVLTVSNLCGSGTDSVLVVDAGPLPSVSLGNDTTLCTGDAFLLTPVFQNVDMWQWSDGSTDPDLLISGPGTYSLVVDNTCGETADTIVVGALNLPTSVSLGMDTTICSGESVMLMVNSSDGDILWPDGSSGNSYMVTDSGWAYVVVSNVCGNVIDSVLISFVPPLLPLNLGIDQSLCPGEIVLIDPGISGVDYLWQDGSTGASFQTNLPDTIVLTISNECESSTDTLIITENNDPPVLDLGPDIVACAGDVVTLMAGISGVVYSWSTGEISSEIIVSASGEFSLTVDNACGTDTDTLFVLFENRPQAQNLGPDLTLCEGEQVVLNANASPSETILWSDLSSASQLIVNTAGQYSVSVSNFCGTSSDTLVIRIDSLPPFFSLGPDTTLCDGEVISLSVPYPGYDVLWQDGQQSDIYVVADSGLIVLTLSNACGSRSDSIEISYTQTSAVLNLPMLISLCPDESAILDATVPVAATYLWNTGAASPVINTGTPGVYWVDVSYTCGSASDTAEIITGTDCFEEVDVYIPNTFSPNDDAINDVFMLYPSPETSLRAIEGQIFDRWGNLVYISSADPFTWDGRFQGEELNPGVFIYIIRVLLLQSGNEREVRYAGDVTLIR